MLNVTNIGRAHRKLRQIRISDNYYRYIKHLCVHQGITITQYIDQLIEDYLTDPTRQSAYYLASHKNGKIFSVWLQNRHLEQIQALAKQANVSDARVIYTAIELRVREQMQSSSECD